LSIGKIILGIVFLAVSIWLLIQADSTVKYLAGGLLAILSLILVIKGLKKKAK
jgi:thiol:disulfide interchange protein